MRDCRQETKTEDKSLEMRAGVCRCMTCSHFPFSVQGQLPATDGSGCRQAAISAAQAFDDAESAEEVMGLLKETWRNTQVSNCSGCAQDPKICIARNCVIGVVFSMCRSIVTGACSHLQPFER